MTKVTLLSLGASSVRHQVSIQAFSESRPPFPCSAQVFPHQNVRFPSIPAHLNVHSNHISFRNRSALNFRLIRFLTRPGHVHASSILSSPRYLSNRHNLFHLVSRPAFTGYWILESSLTQPQPPKASDITIFYLHGGGYFSSQPGTYLLFLLRLAESILAQGQTVSIFALDYHLAPEHCYPTQLREAAAAYSYLIKDQGIPPRKDSRSRRLSRRASSAVIPCGSPDFRGKAIETSRSGAHLAMAVAAPYAQHECR